MNPAKWKIIKEKFATAVELPPSERAGFLSDLDEDVRSEVEKLLAAHESAEDFIDKPIVVENGWSENKSEENLTGQRIDDYVILEKIGEGGMGTVFLAEQRGEDFSQKVALKLVKRGMDTSAVLKRFLMERQILAQLEHPFIARLLDGGSTRDGLPYFVMEYVEGENIRNFCENHRLDTEERLRLFTKVCRAISHAHQKLVVHRDIKPSNIIVTQTGEPKLLDFGIAKLFSPDWHDSTTEATATAFRLMTPEYASPEQFRGKMTTTATDVYSLGVVLYELMTGTRPFDFKGKTAFEISETALTQEPLRPSAAVSFNFQILNSKSELQTDENEGQRTKGEGQKTNPKSKIQNPKFLKGDLDNIILKAIRREPRERYASVEEFVADIERYLNGLPVRATADSNLYRFKKFVGRNRFGTSVAALVLLLSLFSVWQAIRATREQARADERFRQVRSLANAVIFDYQDGIKNLPGATAVREKMVKDGAAYLDKLAAENSSDAELQMELAKAYERLGDVQGNFFTPSLGNSLAAKEFYSKALIIKQNLYEKFPGNSIYAEEIAETFDKLADFEFGNGNQNPAVENYRKAVSLREDILQRNAAEPNIRYLLAKGYRNIAVRGRSKDNTDESLALCRKALAMIEEFLRESPENADYEKMRADFAEGIPIILETNPSRRAEAVDEYRKVIEIRRAQSEKYPTDSVVRQKFGMSYSYLGDTFYELGNLPESVENYKKALEILDPLAEQDASNEQLRQDQSAVRGSLAFSLAEMGDTEESLTAFQTVLRNFEAKYANDPSDKTTHFRIGMAKEGLAKTYENFGKLSAASNAEKIAAYEKALAEYKQSLEIYRIYQDKSQIFPAINIDVEASINTVSKGIENCREKLKILRK